jgi:AcrR family transcriptional regulator
VGRAARSPNRRGEGACLRADILAAATCLLDRSDERALTLRAVAREAGIATPSIYPHFPGQQAILLAVVRAAFAELARWIEAAVGETARQRLYAACHAYLDFATTHPQRYRAMFGSTSGPADLGASVLRPFTGLLTDCVAAGYSASTDPAADAIALWLGLHGLAHQCTVHIVFPSPADLMPAIVDSLAHVSPDHSPNSNTNSHSMEIPHVCQHSGHAEPSRRDSVTG